MERTTDFSPCVSWSLCQFGLGSSYRLADLHTETAYWIFVGSVHTYNAYIYITHITSYRTEDTKIIFEIIPRNWSWPVIHIYVLCVCRNRRLTRYLSLILFTPLPSCTLHRFLLPSLDPMFTLFTQCYCLRQWQLICHLSCFYDSDELINENMTSVTISINIFRTYRVRAARFKSPRQTRHDTSGKTVGNVWCLCHYQPSLWLHINTGVASLDQITRFRSLVIMRWIIHDEVNPQRESSSPVYSQQDAAQVYEC